MTHLLILILAMLTAPPAEATPFGGILGFTKCLTACGPEEQPEYWCWKQWDLDRDGDVDLRDFALLQALDYAQDWP